MATMVIKRLGVLSAAKMYGIILFVFGLIGGILYGLGLMFFGAILGSMGPRGGGEAAAGVFVGAILAMIMIPIIYGVIGFIAGALGAFVYNTAAKFVGGIELELENVASTYGAAPQYGAPPPPQQQPWGQNPY